jgi:hypothetical protein
VRRNPQSVDSEDLVDESDGCGAADGAEADFEEGTEFPSGAPKNI